MRADTCIPTLALALRALAMSAALAAASACSTESGGSQPTPVVPTPTTPTPAPTYTVTGVVREGQVPIPAATVAVADGPNAGKSATADGSGRYSLSGLAFAGFSISASAPRYVALTKGVSLPSTGTSVSVDFDLAREPLGGSDLSDRIEALMLAQGPLADPGNPGCSTGRLSGWRSGVYQVLISDRVNAASRSAVETAIQQANAIYQGAIVFVPRVVSVVPAPRPDEITVEAVDSVQAAGCAANASLCFRTASSPVFSAGRIIGTPNNSGTGFAHEAAHAFLGACHYAAGTDAYARSAVGVAGALKLSDEDVQVARTVWNAGLRAGDLRSRFVSVGLLAR